MRMRYGLNFGRGWQDVEFSQDRQGLSPRIRAAGTALVRVFVNPNSSLSKESWHKSMMLLDAVQRGGASPMIAVPIPPEWKDPGSVRTFAIECGDFAARCADQW